MSTVTTTEFQRHFGMTIDKALKEPVRITQRGRSKVVLLSEETYQALLAAHPQAKAIQTADIPESLFSEMVRPYSDKEYAEGGIRVVPREETR